MVNHFAVIHKPTNHELQRNVIVENFDIHINSEMKSLKSFAEKNAITQDITTLLHMIGFTMFTRKKRAS